jgi:repressor LexA
MSKGFTPRQGQYLVFMYYYEKVNRRPPAEADIQKYFRVSAPTVHQMVLTLEAGGHVNRTPGQARSLRVLVSAAQLPDLE